MSPRIVLATLCLNEIEWLPKLYDQHQVWPGLLGWVFVEGADRQYAETNPGLVRSTGLSKDATTALLMGTEVMDHRVEYVQQGFFGAPGNAQGKCAARNRYLEVADELEPDWIVVLDADEFYARRDQERINALLEAMPANIDAALFRQRYPWSPPSVQGLGTDPFALEVTGGYWDVPHVRAFRWHRGMRYSTNHNWPEVHGRYLVERMHRFAPGDPECVHMAFASELEGRRAKHRYYQSRGEGPKDGRQKYVDCRAAWEVWQPGDGLPQGAKVIPYDGPVPECFK